MMYLLGWDNPADYFGGVMKESGEWHPSGAREMFETIRFRARRLLGGLVTRARIAIDPTYQLTSPPSFNPIPTEAPHFDDTFTAHPNSEPFSPHHVEINDSHKINVVIDLN